MDGSVHSYISRPSNRSKQRGSKIFSRGVILIVFFLVIIF